VGFPLVISNWCSGSLWLWVELLIPGAVGWNKCYRALEQLGLSYQSWSLVWKNSLEPLVGLVTSPRALVRQALSSLLIGGKICPTKSEYFLDEGAN